MQLGELIKALGEGAQLQTICEEHKIGVVGAKSMLRTRAGRRQLRARRMLARIQSELVAQRFGSTAIHRLVELLAEKDAGIRLKTATALLAVAGLDGTRRGGRRGGKGKLPEERYVDMDTAEARELLSAMAEVMERRRAEAREEREKTKAQDMKGKT